MRVSVWQVAIIAFVVILIFGAPKLPELARSLGKSVRILKEEAKALTDDEPAPSDTEDKDKGKA